MVRASEFKPEDHGFNLLARQEDGHFFIFFVFYKSLRVNSCAELFVPHEPPSCVVRHALKMCAHVKDPVSICRKRVGIIASGVATQKYCIHEFSN